eukprot:5033378-Amphidinium_carterae.1
MQTKDTTHFQSQTPEPQSGEEKRACLNMLVFDTKAHRQRTCRAMNMLACGVWLGPSAWRCSPLPSSCDAKPNDSSCVWNSPVVLALFESGES